MQRNYAKIISKIILKKKYMYIFSTLKVQIKCIVLTNLEEPLSSYSREHTSVQTEPAVVHYNRRDSVMETALIIKH